MVDRKELLLAAKWADDAVEEWVEKIAVKLVYFLVETKEYGSVGR